MKEKLKTWYPYLLLTALTFLLVFLITPRGALYGSTTDWENQHIVIPEYFRTLFYSNHQLLPDYAPHLGAGTNIYAFSYYGLFRPDVLISYLLPAISVETIVIAYVIVELAVSVNLCYYWLKKQKLQGGICFFTSLLLLFSSVLFQSHRQIMFMNYMPFLFLALLGIDRYIKKGKAAGMTAAMFCIILHSYFFSVTALFVCGVYFIYRLSQTGQGYIFKGNSKRILGFAAGTGTAVCMAGILLVPTAFYMLGSPRGASASFWEQLRGLNLSLDSLLYSPYGCGLTGIVLCLLLAAAVGSGKYSAKYEVRLPERDIQTRSGTKKLAWFLLLCLASNGFRYLANGTLYARNKIYIALIPLILYVLAVTLDELFKGVLRLHWPVLLLALAPVVFRKGTEGYWIAADIAAAIFCLLYYYRKKSPISLAVMLVLPLVICIHVNARESYAGDRSPSQPGEELKYPVTAKDARFADSTSPLYTSNRVPNDSLYKTSMYSSLSNGDYSRFFYDIMKNPISIRNRAALLTNPNIFFEQFMNIKYMMAKEGTLPAGYQEVSRQGDSVFGVSQDVLPLAYATSSLYSSKDYAELTYPYNLDTIINTAIVPEQTVPASNQYKSKMKKGQPPDLTDIQGIEASGDGYQVELAREEEFAVPLNHTYEDKILLLSFDVKSKNGKEVTVWVNGIRNRLSSRKAPYPNQNKHFTYILSGEKQLTRLKMKMSSGSYSIDNIQLYSLDYGVIKDRAKEVDALQMRETKGREVLAGKVDAAEDGYFITSLPFEKGFKAFVDQKEVKVEKVNTAFVGFPMTKGGHSVRLVFQAPGKRLGIILTGAGFLLFALGVSWEIRQYKKR